MCSTSKSLQILKDFTLPALPTPHLLCPPTHHVGFRPQGSSGQACASLTLSFTVFSFLAGQAMAGLSVGEYLVSEALPLAIAMVRDDRGYSPPEAAETLVSCNSCCPLHTHPPPPPPPPPQDPHMARLNNSTLSFSCACLCCYKHTYC